MSDLSMDSLATSKYTSPALVFTSLGHFINDGTVFFFPLLVDILVKTDSLSAVTVTILLGIFYAAASLFSVEVGRLASRWSNKGTLIGIGLLLMSLGLVGFYYSIMEAGSIVVIPAAAISALSAGIGSSFYHPLGGSVLQMSYSAEKRGKALGINGSMGSVGRALYPSLLYGFAALFTLDSSFLVFGIFAVVAAIAIWLGLMPMANHSKQDHRPASSNTSKRKSTLSASIIILAIVAFIRSTASQGIASWIPSYISNVQKVGISSLLGYSITLMFVAAIIGQPIFGFLADRMDKRVLLSVSSFGTVLSTLGYIYTTGSISLAFLIVFGFFTFSGFPLLFALISEYVPRGDSSLANSVVWGLGNQGGMALGPVLVGLIIVDNYSRLPFSFEVMVIITIFAALAVFLLPRPSGKAKMALFG